MPHILLFDSNNSTRKELSAIIKAELSEHIYEATTTEQTNKFFTQYTFPLFFFHPPLDDTQQSLDCFKTLTANHPNTICIMIVPEHTALTTRQILQSGAHFFLHAPYSEAEFIQIARRSIQHHLLQKIETTTQLPPRGFHNIIGQSAPMQTLFNLIQRLGDDGDSTVLIQGESGTGKELVAKALHNHSPRCDGNFVPINCAAIPEELLESELFGYDKGAFTGAINNKKGRIQHAHGGTLFLDEIGDMKPALQAKLLRVIQEKEFEPVGSVKSIKIDIRIVAATHRDLDKAVADGSFREDLYYRLNVIPLLIPPLRDRRDDIPLLLDTFTHRFCTNKKRNVFTYTEATITHLQNYPWPGNVRELENLVQRLSILHMGETIQPHDIPEKYLHRGKFQDQNNINSSTDFNSRVSEFEDRLILQALVQAGGNKKEAAELLNLKRTTLLEKIKKKQLDKELDKELSNQ